MIMSSHEQQQMFESQSDEQHAKSAVLFLVSTIAVSATVAGVAYLSVALNVFSIGI